jgi:hypothetical protein
MIPAFLMPARVHDYGLFEVSRSPRLRYACVRQCFGWGGGGEGLATAGCVSVRRHTAAIGVRDGIITTLGCC